MPADHSQDVKRVFYFMIPAHEIRVGNIIRDYTGHIRKVSGRDINQQCWYEEGQTGECEAPIDPIQLTAELLEQCNFGNSSTITREALQKNYYRDGSGNYKGYLIDFGKGLWVNVEFLHQLQNLYFALTGKELEINLI